MWLFLLLFVGAPLVELYFLIQVGSVIGALPTIALSVLTAVIGGYLVRMQGLNVLLRVRRAMERDETPALELLDGAVLLVCGFLLLPPGFITDIAGFLLLIPSLRRALLLRYVRMEAIGPRRDDDDLGGGHRPRIIDADYRRED
jgi:UPF0716 protein FxsA